MTIMSPGRNLYPRVRGADSVASAWARQYGPLPPRARG